MEISKPSYCGEGERGQKLLTQGQPFWGRSYLTGLKNSDRLR
ncbi:hypothetical protein [Oscillatoria acuminata]|nr:hypothetical protein [Oscillatoria acuminata]